VPFAAGATGGFPFMLPFVLPFVLPFILDCW
jgi:hypothetical protein